jgi:hypothetical protein
MHVSDPASVSKAIRRLCAPRHRFFPADTTSCLKMLAAVGFRKQRAQSLFILCRAGWSRDRRGSRRPREGPINNARPLVA